MTYLIFHTLVAIGVLLRISEKPRKSPDWFNLIVAIGWPIAFGYHLAMNFHETTMSPHEMDEVA